MKKISLVFALLLALRMNGYTQDVKSCRIMFYNTENFFDTIKDPKTDDAEFTPSGAAHWNTGRYRHKLDNISKVLAAMCGTETPLAIGLSEVENKKVSEDLAHQPALRKYDFGVIEQDSPDPRGIDVALLYNKKLLTVTATEFLRVKLPNTDRGTRDVLYVKGKVKGVELHIFVDHWPSRYGGKEGSEPNRCAAATVVRSKVSQILGADPDARIMVLGDFNDNPGDSAIKEVLGAAAPVEPYKHDHLYDLMTKPFKDGKYTLKYHFENDVFDQVIVSGSFLDKTSFIHIKSTEGNIFRQKWMLFDHPKYGEMPDRTYSGTRYYGGFSDHLPVYVDIQFGAN